MADNPTIQAISVIVPKPHAYPLSWVRPLKKERWAYNSANCQRVTLSCDYDLQFAFFCFNHAYLVSIGNCIPTWSLMATQSATKEGSPNRGPPFFDPFCVLLPALEVGALQFLFCILAGQCKGEDTIFSLVVQTFSPKKFECCISTSLGGLRTHAGSIHRRPAPVHLSGAGAVLLRRLRSAGRGLRVSTAGSYAAAGCLGRRLE
jgi:hypothetical protein